jgi:hypothetical protein
VGDGRRGVGVHPRMILGRQRSGQTPPSALPPSSPRSENFTITLVGVASNSAKTLFFLGSQGGARLLLLTSYGVSVILRS